ncbi:hypothetical protein GGTG_05324 [Gaeumannomyces tritici R3-111a-1]|uniref:ZZ-type domain-containing protein n=1 Tax=Gaeumannomyces tritici (strain R3-111a-1) TaxID=644352 RepID=J3NVK9_GAET3|nr:hypothetical protein GGTG_05324 [Gaeumannomyces tritici R3-111a-1]EJT75387.1 hypothetical protein GGTG_05324 [Gaeumannomyces tritici R3-111a-1]
MTGAIYRCGECEGYHLCFMCYGSRDRLHPPSHGSFVVIGDEIGPDSPQNEGWHVQEEGARLSAETSSRSASPGNGEPFGDSDEGG